MFKSVRTRITLHMALLMVLLLVASGIAVREVMRLQDLSTRVAEIDDSIRRVQQVATAMRDAYAHQAHIIILDDRSHLDHYGDTWAAAVRTVTAARAVLHEPADVEQLEGIARVVNDLDSTFRSELLPHIPGGGGARFAAVHDKAIHLVEAGQAMADALTRRLDAQAADIRSAVSAARQDLLLRCALLVAAGLLLSVVMTIVLDQQIAVPLRRLEVAARRLGNGDLTTRVFAEGNDELASLAQHFNEMATELQVRERRLLEAERLAGVGRLAAGVAHEINNPLGVMLGYVTLIERACDNDDVKTDAQMIRAEIRRCQYIVAGLLELARPPRLNLAAVDVEAIARAAAAALLPLADGQDRVRIRVDGHVRGRADEGKLMQILRNLYANASEAAPDTAIDVVIGGTGDALVIAVTDAGPGLTDEARARLFEPFFTNKPGGTGLGLAVSRSLAEAHGGTLRHVDTAVGATFCVTLPRAPKDLT